LFSLSGDQGAVVVGGILDAVVQVYTQVCALDRRLAAHIESGIASQPFSGLADNPERNVTHWKSVSVGCYAPSANDALHSVWMGLKFTGSSSHARRFEVTSSSFNSAHILTFIQANILKQKTEGPLRHGIPFRLRQHSKEEFQMRSRAWKDPRIKPGQTK